MPMSQAERSELGEQIATLRTQLARALAGKILVVASYKGGLGKSTYARELAWLTGGVLVDLEYDDGAISRAMGYRHETHTTAPLVDSMLNGRTPKPTTRPGCPPFVPAHPDWEANMPSEDAIASSLEQWAAEWQQPVVVDTHPGGNVATRAAASAAHLVVSPFEVAEWCLNSVGGMLRDLRGYPLLLVPNKVKRAPSDRLITRAENLARDAGATLGTPLSRYSWMEERTLRRPLTASDPISARTAPFVHELLTSAQEASKHVC